MYTSLNDYLKREYGRKMYKLSINLGLTCPNRDGTVGTGGCIFCSEGGSGDFAGNALASVTEQIKQQKELISGKFKKKEDKEEEQEVLPSYIAYFQAFTNTYGDIYYLKKSYYEAVNHQDIAIISIATRPDCLGDEVLELLEEINEIKPVWVELGLQTIHEDTAKFINRGYGLTVYDDAIKKLKGIGVKVITHLILGLPGESDEDILESVSYVVNSGSWGIKLQLLHVLKGTSLALQYEKEPFHIYTLDEYVDLVYNCIQLIPEDMVVHRITGDGPKSLLIEPKWSGDKKRVLNAMNKRLRDN